MHPNPAFRGTQDETSLDFCRKRAFGVLAVSSDGAPMLSHVPFLLSDDGAVAELHLVRSNPIARALAAGPMPARLAVSGPDSYVSPDWYGVDDQVPTWNYVAVHLTGTLSLMELGDMDDLLARQSASFETRLAPKPEWKMDKLTEDTRTRLMRSILPCRFDVTALDSTWKLNQNKPEAARLAAAGPLATAGLGHETCALADLMRSPPPGKD